MADTKESKELAPVTPTGFAIIDVPDAKDVMLAAFDQLSIESHQLNQLRVPSGGMTAFEIEDPVAGSEVVQSVSAVITLIRPGQRAWYRESIEEGGGGSPPDCKSEDGRTGVGINSLEKDAKEGSRECVTCHWNQWQSSRGGTDAKDCSEYALIFFFRPGRRLPSVLKVPATSLKSMQNYVMAIIDHGKRVETVVTELSLKKAMSKSGITYSELDFRMDRELGADEGQKMLAISMSLKDRLLGYADFSAPSDA